MSPEQILYTADGLSMRSELYLGVGIGTRPAVLVFPEAFVLATTPATELKDLLNLATLRLPAIYMVRPHCTRISRRSWALSLP